MSRTTIEDEFLFHSEKAGDVVRPLGISAIAVVWLFSQGSVAAPSIPIAFKAVLVLVAASLLVDALHYAVGSVLWGWKVVRQTRGSDSAAGEKRTVHTLSGLVLLKVALMFLAYGFLLNTLARRVIWS